MIIAVISSKGAPGVTDFCIALSVVMPGPKVLLEADPSGADLPFRLRHNDNGPLRPEPTVVDLAANLRHSSTTFGVDEFGQPTTLGFVAIPGTLSPQMAAPLTPLWPAMAAHCRTAATTVIVDCGRLTQTSTAWPFVENAAAVIILVQPEAGGLFRLREQVAWLQHTHAVRGVFVVVRTAERQHRTVVGDVQQVLRASGSAVPVLGHFADDPAGLRLLRGGMLTRSLLGSDLMRSTKDVAQQLLTHLPAVADPVLLADVGRVPEWAR